MPKIDGNLLALTVIVAGVVIFAITRSEEKPLVLDDDDWHNPSSEAWQKMKWVQRTAEELINRLNHLHGVLLLDKNGMESVADLKMGSPKDYAIYTQLVIDATKAQNEFAAIAFQLTNDLDESEWVIGNAMVLNTPTNVLQRLDAYKKGNTFNQLNQLNAQVFNETGPRDAEDFMRLDNPQQFNTNADDNLRTVNQQKKNVFMELDQGDPVTFDSAATQVGQSASTSARFPSNNPTQTTDNVFDTINPGGQNGARMGDRADAVNIRDVNDATQNAKGDPSLNQNGYSNANPSAAKNDLPKEPFQKEQLTQLSSQIKNLTDQVSGLSDKLQDSANAKAKDPAVDANISSTGRIPGKIPPEATTNAPLGPNPNTNETNATDDPTPPKIPAKESIPTLGKQSAPTTNVSSADKRSNPFIGLNTGSRKKPKPNPTEGQKRASGDIGGPEKRSDIKTSDEGAPKQPYSGDEMRYWTQEQWTEYNQKLKDRAFELRQQADSIFISGDLSMGDNQQLSDAAEALRREADDLDKSAIGVPQVSSQDS